MQYDHDLTGCCKRKPVHSTARDCIYKQDCQASLVKAKRLIGEDEQEDVAIQEITSALLIMHALRDFAGVGKRGMISS